MEVAIISTGNELLRGSIADTNAAWMASRMLSLGGRVGRILVVGDDNDAIASALREADGRHDLVLVGGGLGPTEDDVTAAAAADAFGLELLSDPEAQKQVRATFSRMNIRMHEVNLKQALIPSGSTIMENLAGTAPGFSIKRERTRFVFFPGVPAELKGMFDRHVPGMMPHSDAERFEMEFRCFGMGESNLQAAIRDLTRSLPGTRLAFRASLPETGITLSANDKASFEAASDRIRAALGSTIFAVGSVHLPEVLGKALAARGLTAGTAESCTGGLIAHSMTEVPGSSEYFRGGLVCYDNDVKIAVAGVDRELVELHGAVSEQVVKAMAEGSRQVLGVDLSMATSGIAGPSGGTDDKPVGLVHIAVAHPGGVAHRRCMFDGHTRHWVKTASAWTAMRMALDAVSERR